MDTYCTSPAEEVLLLMP